MNFSKLKVSSRLGIGFGAVLTLLAVLAAVGAMKLSNLNEKLTTITEDRVPKLEMANAWIYELMETARHSRNVLIMDDAASRKKELEGMEENKR